MEQNLGFFHQTGSSLWAEDPQAELSSSVLALRLAASLADTGMVTIPIHPCSFPMDTPAPQSGKVQTHRSSCQWQHQVEDGRDGKAWRTAEDC